MSRESWCPAIRAAEGGNSSNKNTTTTSLFSSEVTGNSNPSGSSSSRKLGSKDDEDTTVTKHVDCNRPGIPRRTFDDTLLVASGAAQRPVGSNGEEVSVSASAAQQAACTSYFSGQLADTTHGGKFMNSYSSNNKKNNNGSSVPFSGYVTSISSAVEHPSAPSNAPLLSSQTKQLLGLGSGGESGAITGATSLGAQNAVINEANAAAARAEPEVVLGPGCLAAGVSQSKGVRNGGPLEASTAVLSAAGSYTQKEHHIFNPQSISLADRQEVDAGTHLYPDDVIAHRHAMHILHADADVSLGVSAAEDDEDLFGNTSPRRQRGRSPSVTDQAAKKKSKKGGGIGGNSNFDYSFRPTRANGGGKGDEDTEEDVILTGADASFANFAIKDPRFHSKSSESNNNGEKKNKHGITAPKDVSVKSLEHLLRLLVLKKGEQQAVAAGEDTTEDEKKKEGEEEEKCGVPIQHLSLSGANGAEVPAWALSLLLGTKLVGKEVPTQQVCDAAAPLPPTTTGEVSGDDDNTPSSTPTKSRPSDQNNSLIKSPPAGSARSAVIMNYRVTKETLSSIAQQEKDRATLVAQLEGSIQHLLHESLISLDLSNGVLEPTYAPIDKCLKSLSFAHVAGLNGDADGGGADGDMGDENDGTPTPLRKRGPLKKSEAQKASERAHREALQITKKEKNFYLEQLLNRDVSKRTANSSSTIGGPKRTTPVGDEAPIDADDDDEQFAQLLDGDALEAETEEQERDAALFEDEAVSTAALVVLRDALLPFSARVPVEAAEVENFISSMISERKERKLRSRRERKREALKEALREQGDVDRDEVAPFDNGDIGGGIGLPDFEEEISPDEDEEGEEGEENDGEDEDDDGDGKKRKKKSKKSDADMDDFGNDEEEEENDVGDEDTTFERRKVALFKRLERSRMFVPPVLQNLQNLNLSNNPSLFIDQNTTTSANRLGSTRGAFSIAEGGNSLATALVPGTAAATRAATLQGGSGVVAVYDGAAAGELGSNLVAIEALRTVLLLSSHEYKYRHCFKGFWEEVNKQAQRDEQHGSIFSSSSSASTTTSSSAVPKSQWYHKNALHTLLLSNTGLGTPAAIKSIAQGLKYNTSLHTLDLSRNALGGNFSIAKNNANNDDDEDGVTENHAEKEEAFIGSFANRALKCNKHLKVLDLSENGLSGKMVAALALSLENSIYSFRPKKAYSDDVVAEDEEEAALLRIGEDDEDEQPQGGDDNNADDEDAVDVNGKPKNEVKYFNLKDLYNPDPLALFSSDDEDDDDDEEDESREDLRRTQRWLKKYPHIFDINAWTGLDLGEADEREEASRFAEHRREKEAALRAEEGGGGAFVDNDEEHHHPNDDSENENAADGGDSDNKKRPLEALVSNLFDETYFPPVEDRPKMSAELPIIPEESEDDSTTSDDSDEEKQTPSEKNSDEEGEDEEGEGEDAAAAEEEEVEEIPEEDEETKLKRLAKEYRRDERVWKKKMRYYVWIPEQLHLFHDEQTTRRTNLLKEYKKQMTLLKIQELFTKRTHVLKLEARRVDAEIRRSKLGWSELQLLSLQRNPAVGDKGAMALAKALRHTVPVTSEQERIHEQQKRVALLKYVIQCVVSREKRDIRKQVTATQQEEAKLNAAGINIADEDEASSPQFDTDESSAAVNTNNNGEEEQAAIPPPAAPSTKDNTGKKRRSSQNEDGEDDEENDDEEEEDESEDDIPDEVPEEDRFDDNENGDEDEENTRKPRVFAPVVVETEEPLEVVFDEDHANISQGEDYQGATPSHQPKDMGVILYYFKNPIPVRTLVMEEIERHGLASILIPIPVGIFTVLIKELFGSGNLHHGNEKNQKGEQEGGDDEEDDDEAPFSSPEAADAPKADDEEDEENEEDEDEQKAEMKRVAALEKRMSKLPYGDRTASRPGFRSLQHLNLEGCGIGSAGIKKLAETIGENNLSLRTLNLAQNNRFAIRRKKKTEEEKEAEEALVAQDEIDTNGDEDEMKKVLMLRKAHLKDHEKYDLTYVSPAMTSLSNAIKLNNTLVTLDLSYCRLYPAALMSLATGLAANRTLKHLNLRGNFLGCLSDFVGPDHVKANNRRLYSPLAYLLAGLVEEATNGPCSLETLILDGNTLGAPEACGLVTSNNTDYQVVGAQESAVFDQERGEYSDSVVEEVLAKKESLLALDDAAATLLAHLCHSSLSSLSLANNNISNEDLARLSNGVFELAMDKKVGGGEGSAVSKLVNELLGLNETETPEDHKRMGGKRSSITDIVDEEEKAAAEESARVAAAAVAPPPKEQEEEEEEVDESRMLAFKRKVGGPGANAGGKPLRAAGASFCVNTTATLQSLNVGRNTRLSGEAGATSIARMLQFMSRLEELYIDGCHGLGDNGFELICLKIRSHNALKVISAPRIGITSLQPLVAALEIKLGQMRDGQDKKPMALAALDVSDNDLTPESIDAFSKIVVEGKRIQVVSQSTAALGGSMSHRFGGSVRFDAEPVTFGVASVRRAASIAFVSTPEAGEDRGSSPHNNEGHNSAVSSGSDEEDDDYCPPPCADPYGEEDVTPSVALERQASRAVLNAHKSDDEEDAPMNNKKADSDDDTDSNVKSPLSIPSSQRASPSPANEGKVTGLSLVPMLRYVSIWNRRAPADAQHLHSSLLFAIRRLVDEGFLDDFCVPTLSTSLSTFFANGRDSASSITTSLTNLLRSHGKPLLYTPPVLSSSTAPTSPTSDDSNVSMNSSVAQGIHNALVAAERSVDMSAACTISLLAMLEEPGCVTAGDYIPIPDPNNLRPALSQATSSGGYLQSLMNRVEVNQILRRRLRRLRIKRRNAQEKLGESNSLVPTFLQLFIEEQQKLTQALTELAISAAGASTSDAAALNAAYNVSNILKSILSKQHSAIAYYATEFKVKMKKEIGHQYVAAFPESQPNAAELTTMQYPPPNHAAKSTVAGFSLDADATSKTLEKQFPIIYRDGVLVAGASPRATTTRNEDGDDEEEDGGGGTPGIDGGEEEEEVPTYIPLDEDAVLELTDPVEEAAMGRLTRRLAAAVKHAQQLENGSAAASGGLPNFKLPPTTNEMDVRSTALASHNSAISLGGLLSLLIPTRYSNNANNEAIEESCPLAEMEWACLRNRLL